MNTKHFFLGIFTLLFSLSAFSSSIVQQQFHSFKVEKDISLITGFQSGTYSFAEIGIGIKKDVLGAPHPSTLIFGVTNELKINKGFVWGLKLGAWTGGGVGGTNIGLNLIHYTSFNSSAFRFRPEVGMGFGHFRMVYGYNFTVTNKHFDQLNTHLFALHILLDLKPIRNTVTNDY
jgi:hypothetical protein